MDLLVRPGEPAAGLDAAQLALKYKQLWMVTIRGHVFCSFLVLVLRAELARRLDELGEHGLQWQQILRDLKCLQLSQIEARGKRFLLRSEVEGTAGTVCRAVGVALPPTIQAVDASEEVSAL